jgi:guanylate kinase
MPPSIEDLHKRLVARASETPETLQKRVQKAEHELTYSDRFSHVIINGDREIAFKEAEELVNDFLD